MGSRAGKAKGVPLGKGLVNNVLHASENQNHEGVKNQKKKKVIHTLLKCRIFLVRAD